MISIIVWVIIIISILMFIFQSALTLGAEWGNLAWGGNYKKLPPKLRIGSMISAFLFILSILVVLEKSNKFFTFDSQLVVDILIWVFAAIFGLSLIGNINSKSSKEKKVMTPVAMILFISFILLGIFGK